MIDTAFHDSDSLLEKIFSQTTAADGQSGKYKLL
jgi:hypothetical protein